MIIQVQDATINPVDSSSYGDGSSSPSFGAGMISPGLTGQFEYNVITDVSGSTITIEDSLQFSYRASPAQSRWMIVEVRLSVQMVFPASFADVGRSLAVLGTPSSPETSSALLGKGAQEALLPWSWTALST